MRIVLMLCFCAVLTFGQVSHTVTLTWSDTQNPAGTTYTIYRGDGNCNSGPTFNRIAEAVAVKTYVDSAVNVGHYCYQVTAVYAAMESAPSNQAGAAVKPFPPTTLDVVVK